MNGKTTPGGAGITHYLLSLMVSVLGILLAVNNIYAGDNSLPWRILLALSILNMLPTLLKIGQPPPVKIVKPKKEGLKPWGMASEEDSTK